MSLNKDYVSYDERVKKLGWEHGSKAFWKQWKLSKEIMTTFADYGAYCLTIVYVEEWEQSLLKALANQSLLEHERRTEVIRELDLARYD